MSAPTYRIIRWDGGPIACDHHDAGWLIVWDDDPDRIAGPFESKESALLHVTAFLEALEREEAEYARLEESYENPEDWLYSHLPDPVQPNEVRE